MTTNGLIAFYELRIKTTKKIIDSLQELKNTNLTTPLVDREIDIQKGECEVFVETLFHLKAPKNVVITEEQRKVFLDELHKSINESVNLGARASVDPEKVIPGEPVKVRHWGFI